MAEAPSEAAVRARHKGGISAVDELAATKDLQRLTRRVRARTTDDPISPLKLDILSGPDRWKPLIEGSADPIVIQDAVDAEA